MEVSGGRIATVHILDVRGNANMDLAALAKEATGGATVLDYGAQVSFII